MDDSRVIEKRGRTLRTPRELADANLISPDQVAEISKVQDVLSIAISPEMLARITTGQKDDPVARQFVPDLGELDVKSEERPDPIGDAAYVPVKGIVHRYPDRLLLIPVHTCAVYCRFCFRREKVGPGEEYLNESEMAVAIEYIRSHHDLREVILTGGDPLILSPRRIGKIVADLSATEHLDVIRFHTRIPVVAPERITPALMDALDTDKIVCVVVHANHASEFGQAAKNALKRLRKAGIMLVSHSVLLKGINDTPQALSDLLREFVRNGVKPYYLHHCDLVEGTSHFRTSFEDGLALMRAIRGRVSGLAQPTYALHIPGGYGKVPIDPSYLERSGDSWIVTDYLGGRHVYPPSNNAELKSVESLETYASHAGP
jgi:lysine 2,3-aminomutase